jgi:hypothetical protein
VSGHITDFTMFMTTRNENLVVFQLRFEAMRDIILHADWAWAAPGESFLTSSPASWRRDLMFSDPQKQKLGLPAVPADV